MDAIKLLKQQHKEAKALLHELENTSAAAVKTRASLFAKVADALAGHAEIEEKLFYPAVRAPNTEDLLAEALEEHLAARRLIADLLALDPADATFAAKCTVLREQIEHHVEEEEGEIFKEARKLLKTSELEDLGMRMEKLYDSLEKKSPRLKVPQQTNKAARLR